MYQLFDSATHSKEAIYTTDDQWFYKNLMSSPYFIDGLILIIAMLAVLFNTLVRTGFYH